MAAETMIMVVFLMLAATIVVLLVSSKIWLPTIIGFL